MKLHFFETICAYLKVILYCCREGSIIVIHTVETQDIPEDLLPVKVVKALSEALNESKGIVEFENTTAEVLEKPQVVILKNDGTEEIGKLVVLT